MEREVGDKGFPIWMLGDSNPRNWQDVLITPLDPRHPARHSIWTPILEIIQDRVYRKNKTRVETSSIYIRNAIGDPQNKPLRNIMPWGPHVQTEIETFGQLLKQHQPAILFTFGSFSFEFARRAQQATLLLTINDWGTKALSQEFKNQLVAFNLSKTNVLPLLHTSISRGRFIESHNYFSEVKGGNYFEFAGVAIADKLIEYRDQLRIWVE
jgi:hypothetical protein